MLNFIGRKHELTLLDEQFAKQEAALLILYGRRRVGKTRLLTHWLKQYEGEGLYWVAQPSSSQLQLRAFSQAIYNFANPDRPAPLEFSYATWEQALEQVAELATTRRFFLFIDEFTYLLMNDPSIAGVFQNGWDHLLKQRNLFLVLCGSHLGMMQRHTLAYQAPLYGRASAQLRLEPLPFGVSAEYFPNYDAAERVALYSIFGGIPAYWERVNQSLSISENIRLQLLTPNNLMQAEPRLLLQDFVREPDNYVAMLTAIANNYRTQKEISTFTGLSQGHVSQYISTLNDAGFVERRVPVTAKVNARTGRYHIRDPYLRFYYRFLASRQAQLALNIQEPALAEVKRHLLDFIGTHTWEELCREWTMRAGANGTLPFLVDQVGGLWTKTAQIDVAGSNTMKKTLVLGECKWSPKVQGVDVLEKLVRQSADVIPTQGKWRIFYVGFARGGWSDAARQFAASQTAKGKNWHSVGWQLLDLEQIDKHLREWI